MAWSDSIDFGEWLPDQPTLSAPALRLAQNVIPRARGYDMWPTPIDAGRGSLDTFCRGAFSSRSRQGTDFVVAGTTGKLHLATTGALSDVTWVTAPYTSTTRWNFDLFGDDVIAVNYDDVPQRYVLGTSTVFAAVHADAPRARHCAVVREFLVFGNLVGRGVHAAIYGTREDGVHWGGQGSSSSWPQTGTSAAQAVLSDWQPIVDEGGEITSMVGGTDYGLIFKRRSIHRMDFVGGSEFFIFNRIDAKIGAYVPGSALRIGGVTYFLSESGVYASDGSNPSQPIGNERVDRWLHNHINHTRLERVAAFQHPTKPLIGWTFMSNEATGNAMDMGLLYNWAVNRFTALAFPSEWMVAAVQAGASLDAAPYAAGNLDTTYAGLDLDSLTGGVERELSVFNASHRLDTLTGSPAVGAIQTGEFELTPGRISFVRAVRPLFDEAGSTMSLSLYTRNRLRVDALGSLPVTDDATGKFNVRSSGRYHSALIQYFGPFQEVHGLAADVIAQGMR